MSALPIGWTETAIDSVCVPTEQIIPEADLEFTYIDISSVDRVTKRISKPQRVLGKNAPSRARKLVKAGDTIVSLTRPNLNAVALVGEEYSGQIASTGFEILRTTGLEYRWIGYLVRTNAFVDAMSSLVQGALYPAIRGKDVRAFEIPLAPLPEQRRIADKLDTILTRVDALNDRLARLAPLLKRFRQSVLAAATSGRLTEDWNENATCEEWRTTTLSEICFVTKLAGFEYTNFVKYINDGDLNVVKAENVGKDGFKYTKFSKVKSESVYNLNRSKIKAGDLLMVFVGAGTGQVGRVPPGENWFLGPNVAMIRLISEKNDSRYIEYFLRSQNGKNEIKKFVKSTAQPSLSMTSIRQFEVSLPCLEEQTEIVRRVEILFAYADRLEARLQTARTAAERLTPALLAKAFRGELVPQDPNDEPATELLRRLREARAAEAPAKRTRGRKSIA